MTNSHLSLGADAATRGLSALVSFFLEYCCPMDSCFMYHLLPPVSLHCYQCNTLLVSDGILQKQRIIFTQTLARRREKLSLLLANNSIVGNI